MNILGRTISAVVLGSGILAGANVSAANFSTVDEVVPLLENSMPKDLDNVMKVGTLSRTADGHGIVMPVTFAGDNMKYGSDTLLKETMDRLSFIFAQGLCEKMIPQYFAAGNYIDVLIGDEGSPESIKRRFDASTCKEYAANGDGQDIIAMGLKQNEQGYFDNDYLSWIAKQMHSSLPIEMGGLLEVYDVSAQDRELVFNVRGKGQLTTELLAQVLSENKKALQNVMTDSNCNNPYTSRILKNTKGIRYVFDGVSKGDFVVTANACPK